MRMRAITSRIDDIVQPTDKVIAHNPTLQAMLAGCPSRVGKVIYVFNDRWNFPIVVEFENGHLYSFEQFELE